MERDVRNLCTTSKDRSCADSSSHVLLIGTVDSAKNPILPFLRRRSYLASIACDANREGRKIGHVQGFGLGKLKGWESGWELGRMAGTLSCLERIHAREPDSSLETKVTRKCRSFLEKLKDCPIHTTENEDLQSDINRFRGRYKSIVRGRDLDLSYLSQDNVRSDSNAY